MIVSSAFVLTALTMTGIYMKSNDSAELDDGYTIDFTAFDDDLQEKLEEIERKHETADNDLGTGWGGDLALGGQDSQNSSGMQGMDNDLDYFPMEVGSGQIEIPGLTDRISGNSLAGEEIPGQGNTAEKENVSAMGNEPLVGDGMEAEEQVSEPETEADSGQEEQNQDGDSRETAARVLHFSEDEGLLRPVSGEVLIPFSTDTTVYFSTLDQFKCNPALVLAAETGSAVLACAEARVVDIFENEEIGQAVTMELGDGYQITYGQLEAVNVTVGTEVEAGEVIGWIAKPTKYYCVEGSNLYLKLTSGGIPVNPETLFR